jgi:hypothetical protein
MRAPTTRKALYICFRLSERQLLAQATHNKFEAERSKARSLEIALPPNGE